MFQASRDSADLDLFLSRRAALVGYANRIVGNRTDAEDIVQQAWLRFGERSHTTGQIEPFRYLFRIVRNLAIDEHRRRARAPVPMNPADLEDTSAQAGEATCSAEAVVTARDDLRVLQDALDELPERTRIAVELRCFRGAKLREIAVHLGISTSHAHELVADGLAHCQRRVRPVL